MQKYGVPTPEAIKVPRWSIWSNYPGWGSGSQYSEPQVESKMFDYSGFGKNPKGPPWVEPVPGTYNKRWWSSNYLRGDHNQYVRQGGATSGPYTGWWKRSGVCDGPTPRAVTLYPHAYDPTTYNNALSDLWEKIKGVKSPGRSQDPDFESSGDPQATLGLAEARETGRMVRDIARAFRDEGSLILSARRFRRDLLRNPSLVGAGSWLGYQYGLRPTIDMVYELAKYTGRFFSEGITFDGRARRIEKVTRTDTYPEGPSGSPMPHRTTGKLVWKAQHGVNCTVQSLNNFDLARLGVWNPASIAWELTTLSFVVDWFIDIGGYLQNMEAALFNGLKFNYGWTTQIHVQDLQEVVSHTYFDASAWPMVIQHDWYGKGIHFRATKSRVKLLNFPLPELPRLEIKLGWQRILSATSLARTIMLGRVK